MGHNLWLLKFWQQTVCHLKISFIYSNSILIIIWNHYIEIFRFIFCCEKKEKLNFCAVHTLVQIRRCASFESSPVSVKEKSGWEFHVKIDRLKILISDSWLRKKILEILREFISRERHIWILVWSAYTSSKIVIRNLAGKYEICY